MGEAKRRGTFEERREAAIKEYQEMVKFLQNQLKKQKESYDVQTVEDKDAV